MRRRRSIYDPIDDSVPDLVSPYFDTEDGDDGTEALLRSRSATAPDPGRYRHYAGGGGGGGALPTPGKQGPSAYEEPEARGSEPPTVTTPDQDPYRDPGPEPGKTDRAAGARMRLAAAEDDLEKATKEATTGIGSLAFGGYHQRRVGLLANRVDRLRNEIAYEDNRHGQELQMRLNARLEQEKLKTAAKERETELRRNEKPFPAEGKMWIDRGKGPEPYLKPSTQKEMAGPPVPGASMQATIPGEQFAAEPKEGKIHSVAGGYVDEKNQYHRTIEQPAKEDPIEKRAAGAANTAYAAWIRDHPDDQFGAEQAYSSAYNAARKVGINAREGKEPEGPPKRKNFRNNQTGALEPFVWDEKARKYVPERG